MIKLLCFATHRLRSAACLFFLLPNLLFSQSAKLDPTLYDRMNADPAGYHEVIIELADRLDSRAMLVEFETNRTPLNERAQQTIVRLAAKAGATQPALVDRLKVMDGVDASSIRTLWIVNAICIKAKTDAILRMTIWPEVENLLWNAPVEILQPVSRETAPSAPNGKEVGLSAIKAPFMWNLGYTGYGRKALVIDSGNDWEHPALIDNFWGHQVPVQQAWNGTKYPEDCAEHGTHVTGTVCGLDRKTNDTIGVAFNAHWMGGPMQFPVGSDLGCARSFNQTVFENTATMQWALNPDGNAATSSDRPDVVNCSWRSPNFGCNLTLATNTLNALEAAGIGVVWAQGNEGPNPGTVSSGAAMNMDLVNTFSVGAIDGANPAFPVADFSSRGPTPCGNFGPLAIKPEVSAPGVSVRSSTPGGSYQSFNGTSMAAPHVAGAVVLLREAFPYLSGIQIKLALYNTAIDLGTTGEDNNTGRGIITLEGAYNYLVNQGNVPVPPVSAERDALVINLEVKGQCKGPVAATLTIENGGIQPVTSLQIQYGIEGTALQTFNWTGNLGTNANATIALPDLTGVVPGDRIYVVELLNPNGQPDTRPLNNKFRRPFTLHNEDYPTGIVSPLQPLPVCSGAQVLLEYTGTLTPQEKVRWFGSVAAVSPLAESPTYRTAGLTANTTLYVSTFGLYKVGKPDQSGTSTSNSAGGGLNFNVTKPFLLKSVKIYADQPGVRLMQLQDRDGNVLISKPIIVPQAGERRVDLNIDIAVGDNQRLMLTSGSPNPLKQVLATNTYPQQVPGVVNIHSGAPSGGGSTQIFYYYFFDWEIEVPSVCGRTTVQIPVSTQVAPSVSFTATPDTTYISGGGTVAFTEQAPGSTSRHWNFGNGQTSTTANPSATYTQTGTYLARLISVFANGCSNIAEKNIVVLQTSSASDLPGNVANSVSLYPNPATDELVLAFAENSPTNVDIRVSDLLGRTLRAIDGTGGSALRIDVSDLPVGMYSVLLYADGNPYWAGKFVKK
ncbi:MAG: S8 family serine peptidase [Saprospiraceae bacterium]